MLKIEIEGFKKKYPAFELEDFLNDFEQGATREGLSIKYGISEMPLRVFVAGLGLDWIKSRRLASITDFRYRLGLENNIHSVSIVKELETELSLLQQKNRKLYQSLTLARDENNALRKESRDEVRNLTFEDMLLNSFEQHIYSLGRVEIISKEVIPSIQVKQSDGLMLILGDSHWGDVSTTEECGNNYNFEIASRRLDYMINKTLTNPNQSRNLVVVELLDILKGIIHSSEYLSEEGVTGSMIKVVEMYSKAYLKLAPHYDKISIVVTNSNHDRTTQWVSSFMKYDNFGILLYRMIEMLITASGVNNIEFKYTKQEHHLINVNSADIFITHGDAIRTYKAASPAERAKVQAISLGMFKKPYKHMISGHLHQSIAASNEYGGYNIVNGTMVGNSTYGVSNGFTSIEPVQTILFLDEKGDIEQTSFINLGHIQ